MYGQTAASPATSASDSVRSLAACSLTMLPTRSSSAARSPDRSAVMRPTESASRRSSSMRAHSDATPCSNCGKPPLAASRRSTGTSTSSVAPA